MLQRLFKSQLDLASYVAYAGAGPIAQAQRCIERRAIYSHLYDSNTFSVRDEKKIISAMPLSFSNASQMSVDAPSTEHSANTSISKTAAEAGISSVCVIIAVAASFSNGTRTRCMKLVTIGGTDFGTRGPVVRY